MILYKDKMSKILTFSVGIIKYYYMTVFFFYLPGVTNTHKRNKS